MTLFYHLGSHVWKFGFIYNKHFWQVSRFFSTFGFFRPRYGYSSWTVKYFRYPHPHIFMMGADDFKICGLCSQLVVEAVQLEAPIRSFLVGFLDMTNQEIPSKICTDCFQVRPFFGKTSRVSYS